jgi:hypothetical protein
MFHLGYFGCRKRCEIAAIHFLFLSPQERGNWLFKRKDFDGAVKSYNMGLGIVKHKVRVCAILCTLWQLKLKLASSTYVFTAFDEQTRSANACNLER